MEYLLSFSSFFVFPPLLLFNPSLFVCLLCEAVLQVRTHCLLCPLPGLYAHKHTYTHTHTHIHTHTHTHTHLHTCMRSNRWHKVPERFRKRALMCRFHQH